MCMFVCACVFLFARFSVLAGTQGTFNHFKKDRMFELAREWQIPVVFFAEGGGGRPGDTDGHMAAGGQSSQPSTICSP